MSTGFVPLLGVFFCIFHPTQGSKVMCQVPDGCVIPTPTSEVERLIEFGQVKNYLIPKPAFCNKLVTLKVASYRVVGFPVNIVGKEYERNSFTFNFVWIFPAHGNYECYESSIIRFAKTTRVMEEQSHFLSTPDNIHEIDTVLEQMYQDINSFSECQIPIGGDNKVNIKLFPISESPPIVRRYHVPVPTVRLNNLLDEHWDPTMERIIPYLNGINSVRKIADLAEADYNLVKQCVSHLIHYNCVIIIGIFQFSNIYAPTPELTTIATNVSVYHELLAFVYHPSQPHGTQSNSSTSSHHMSNTPFSHSQSHSHSSSLEVSMVKLSIKQVFDLYSSFGTGQSVYTWYQDHKDLLQDIDVRRFVIFGVVKRIIMRIHAFPIYDNTAAPKPDDNEIIVALQAARLPYDKKTLKLINQCLTNPTRFDDLCSGLRASRAKVSKLLRSLGEWTIVNR